MLVIYFFCMIAMPYAWGNQVLATGHNSLMNKHLKVAAVRFSPFIIIYCHGEEINELDECPDKGNMTYGGVMWDLLKFVHQARNVTFSILHPPIRNWGYCYGVNNCSGMIGMVNQREVDFALGIFM